MIDYIIIGCGLAGIAYAEKCTVENKSYLVISDQSQNSSIIAAGIYNPIILKRFTGAIDAEEQLKFTLDYYKNLEKKLETKFVNDMPILRKFASLSEQNDWFVAADKSHLSTFLDTKIVRKKIEGLDAKFDYGRVLKTGYLDTSHLIKKYIQFLEKKQTIIKERFEYSEIKICKNYIIYRNIKCKNILFAEGFGIHSNPYFTIKQLKGTKGELVIIRSKKLDLETIINASLYIVPLGNYHYKIGATYHWEDKTLLPTSIGRNELINKLKEILTCEFTIVDHLAGIRPTVKDRNPIIGTHPLHKNLHILNGLGTRGVILAPILAHKLYNSIENQIPIPKEIDFKRYFETNV